MRRTLFNRYSLQYESFFEFVERFRGILVVRNIITNHTNATHGRDRIINLSQVTNERVQAMIEEMEQSGGIMTLLNTQLIFLYLQRVEGAGKVTLPKFDCVNLTWKQHFYNLQPVNCAAFAIAYHMATRKILKNIILQAVKIQTELKWGEMVTAAEISTFVDYYKSYRVTIILPSITNHKATTYTGSEYIFEHDNNKLSPSCRKKTIYLIWDGIGKHYGLADPVAQFKYVKNSKSYIFCHNCQTIKKRKF